MFESKRFSDGFCHLFDREKFVVALEKWIKCVGGIAHFRGKPLELNSAILGRSPGCLKKRRVAFEVENDHGRVTKSDQLFDQRHQSFGSLAGPGASHYMGMVGYDPFRQQNGVAG